MAKKLYHKISDLIQFRQNMPKPENQTEDEMVTSDFLESSTEGVTSDDQISYKRTDDDETNEDIKKNRSWMDEGSASRMKS